MQVLVAPNEFKGSLSAADVARALGEGIARAGVEPRLLPLADGGDGSVTAALHAGAAALTVLTQDATGAERAATIAMSAGTAVVEVANTCGLSTLPTGDLRPMTASSYGFGQAVRGALRAGARRIVLCLGGSASTDGGVGMLTALGARFTDDAGELVTPDGAGLARIHAVDVASLVSLEGIDLVVAADVTSPLGGPTGAAAVFGPQKGATPAQVVQLDDGLHELARLLGATRGGGVGTGLAGLPGSGAAGGLGFACRWLGARMEPGADHFLDLLRFDEVVADAAAVITGEGRLDAQTAAGKLPAVVAARAAPRPVHAVVGRCDLSEPQRRASGFDRIVALADLTDADTRSDAELSRCLLVDAGWTLAGVAGRAIPSSRPPITR